MDESANIVAIRERQTELILIIEAIDEVLKNKGWQALKEKVFDKEVARYNRLLLAEAMKTPIEVNQIYILQGERTTVKRYADLRNYAEVLKKELEGIKLKLQ